MKFPPISTRSKLSWASSKVQSSASVLQALSWGFTLGKNPYIGVALGATSSVLTFLKEADVYNACEGWEYSTDTLINSSMKNLTRKNATFVLEGTTFTHFWEISEGVWVGTKDRWESWWYPNFETGIKSFLSTQKFWSVKNVKDDGYESFSFESDIEENLEAFPLFHEIKSKIDLYLEKGESRCVLFTGPPGTGKTSLITQIAKTHQNYLRIPFYLAKEKFFWDLALIMKFSVLIIDDIDHGNLSNSMLSNLEKVRKVTPLILMSSNSTSSIKGAILRPGRVDEIVEVRTPDPELLKKLSTEVPLQYHKELEGLYVSYVKELNTRCKVEGTSNIESWIVEMHDRVKSVGDGWNNKDTHGFDEEEEED